MLTTSNPLDTLAAALHAACLRDLPDIHYLDRDWVAHRAIMNSLTREQKADLHAKEKQSGQAEGPMIEKTRRPTPADVEVRVFPQMWGSTALGYGGLGGAAMTKAYSIVVSSADAHAVYFGNGGRLAYLVPKGLTPQAMAFEHNLATSFIADCQRATELYGAIQVHGSGKPRVDAGRMPRTEPKQAPRP